ncbi:phosphate acyltransferase PlsX [Puia sp.]|jgi:glycerol-3-phosphate acyltransferase PlsX|uniref:phosphate acyltransferase PlsX n=1 Tax=Puia sp. TaxID=2045100 RepID=UPI002F40B59E
MNIGLDMMGGDFSPLEAVKGIQLYLKDTLNPATLWMVGDENQVRPLLKEYSIPEGSVRLIHASEVIGMNEHPTKALKEKQQSSIAIGFGLLAAGKMDAFISAGNTGAMLVGALYGLKPIEGVQRPTISTVIPKENGKTGILLDVGLNADCKAENLNQFAILGSLYAKHILGIDNPRVGLLNIGEEEGKGNILAQATYPLLKENSHINFIGNIEGRDILLDRADVTVCEGFTGNVILKLAESLFEISQRHKTESEFFDRFDFEYYGGTPLLGVTKPVIIGHGISRSKSFLNMIRLAQKMLDTDLLGKMKEHFVA